MHSKQLNSDKANISDLNNLSELVSNVKNIKLLQIFIPETGVPANGCTDVQVKYGITIKKFLGSVVSLAASKNNSQYGSISVASVIGSFGTTQGTIRFLNNTDTIKYLGANIIIIANV